MKGELRLWANNKKDHSPLLIRGTWPQMLKKWKKYADDCEREITDDVIRDLENLDRDAEDLFKLVRRKRGSR